MKHKYANLPFVSQVLIPIGNAAVVVSAKCTRWRLPLPPPPLFSSFNYQVVSIIKYLSWLLLQCHGNVGQRSAGQTEPRRSSAFRFCAVSRPLWPPEDGTLASLEPEALPALGHLMKVGFAEDKENQLAGREHRAPQGDVSLLIRDTFIQQDAPPPPNLGGLDPC